MIEVFKREDGRWAWHLKVKGRVVATDGGQGYERRGMCVKMAEKVCNGDYREAGRRRRRRLSAVVVS